MRPRWSGIFIFLVAMMTLPGAFLVGVGVDDLVTTRRFLAKADSADGVVVKVDKVVDYEFRGSGDDQGLEKVTTYYPVVRFVTASEQVVEWKPEGSESAYWVGDSVRVVYDPADPQQAQLDSASYRWLHATVQMVAGVAFLAAGLVVLLLSRESGSERPGRGGKASVRARPRRPRPIPPGSGAEQSGPPHREPPEDKPQDSRVQDE